MVGAGFPSTKHAILNGVFSDTSALECSVSFKYRLISSISVKNWKKVILGVDNIAWFKSENETLCKACVHCTLQYVNILRSDRNIYCTMFIMGFFNWMPANDISVEMIYARYIGSDKNYLNKGQIGLNGHLCNIAHKQNCGGVS